MLIVVVDCELDGFTREGGRRVCGGGDQMNVVMHSYRKPQMREEPSQRKNWIRDDQIVRTNKREKKKEGGNKR